MEKQAVDLTHPGFKYKRGAHEADTQNIKVIIVWSLKAISYIWSDTIS